MAIKDRKPRQGRELREKILQASQRILMEDGFAALTMRRVAEEIEYSPTTLYLYFENREAIVAELGRNGLSRLAEELSAVVEVKDPLKRLEHYAERYLRFSEENPEAYRLIFMENEKLADAIFRGEKSAEASDAGAKAFGFFVEAFAELANERSEWKKRPPLKTAEVFWAMLHGIASLKITCGKFLRTDSRSLVQLAAPALLAGLALES